jgi:hypothetical protein
MEQSHITITDATQDAPPTPTPPPLPKITPSDEQTQIIDYLLDNKNVVVDAVAGSGKSTTVIFVAEEFRDKKLLQLTYNSNLRKELKEKVDARKITNLDIHTFHSIAVNYYSSAGYTDIELRKIVRDNTKPRGNIPKYDIVIIDEKQDVTHLYFRFIYKLILDINHPVQLLILGDPHQSLYQFKGSDVRFLTMADKIWDNHPLLVTRDFVHTTLKTSYRITRPMAQFVNEFMLGEPRMEACKDGSPVVYIHYSNYNLANKVIFEITKLIKEGAKPEDFFILAGTLNQNIIRRIENALVENNIKCNIPMFENEGMDENVIRGKVVFSTFHSVKGRQRPYVFVVGFNQSYMNKQVRDEPHNICPNTLYVGCTRASEILYLLEEDNGYKDRSLKFLKYGHMEMDKSDFVSFKGVKISYEVEADDGGDKIPPTADREYPENSTPSKLIRFITEDVFDKIIPIIEKIFIVDKPKMATPLNMPAVKQMKEGNYEEISDINGIAIPCLYCDFFLKKLRKESGHPVKRTSPCSSIYKIVENEMKILRTRNIKIYNYVESKMKEIPKNSTKTCDYLYLTNIYIAIKENMYFKLHQISKDDYNWLSASTIRQTHHILRDALAGDYKEPVEYGGDIPEFSIEETIIQNADDYTKMDSILREAGIRLFRLTARVDLITPTTVWELKCTSETTIEHMLQVVIYAWIWRIATEREHKEFKILNIKTGEIKRLCATDDELNTVVFELLKNKYRKYTPRTTEEFLQETGEIHGSPESGLRTP